jgi:hypothetical protein
MSGYRKSIELYWQGGQVLFGVGNCKVIVTIFTNSSRKLTARMKKHPGREERLVLKRAF